MSNSFSFGARPSGRFFLKMHGLKNHFVITDARQAPYRPAVAEIVRVCDVRTGIGADQLIVVEPPTTAGAAAGALAFMRIFNVDGREAEACGNATRCVAWLLLEESAADQVRLETLAGVLACRRTGHREVSCDMGRVSMHWQDVPLSEERDTCHLDIAIGPLEDAVALNIGNPHVVFFAADVETVDLAAFAPQIQAMPLFPESVNVGVAQRLASDRMKLRVYERGAGLTEACGSGACVAHYAALARGLTEARTMRVALPAGEVRVDIDDDGVATMTGPVAYCYSGYY